MQVIFPFLFAAASAGLIGAPLTSYPVGHATFASPLAVGVAHAPLVPAPAIYNAPIVKHVTPVAYSAPVVKTVIPAATSYANTYRVSTYYSFKSSAFYKETSFFSSGIALRHSSS